VPKTEAISLRVSAEVKEALQMAAERDHRTLASLVVIVARKLVPASGYRNRPG
jgi:uncharacterized protein (DUF1778 family)